MSYTLHPEAADEHRQQVAYYEKQQIGLGRRYHAEFRASLALACEMPLRPRIVHLPDIRCLGFKIFHFNIVYREVGGLVQVLAVAHHRREPGYWRSRAGF